MNKDSRQGHTSLTGLTEWVASLVEATAVPGSRILDLGAGTGNLAQRLTQAGHTVTAADRDKACFEPNDVPHIACDLNGAFAEALPGPVDGIVATEILEHLENPRSFLRQCRTLLKPSGWLLVTTPNLENPVSKALFVRHDHFLWFSDKERRSTGHITPIGRWFLTTAAQDSGLTVERVDSYGCPYDELGRWPSMHVLARALAWLSKTPKLLRGEILCIVLRRTA